MEASRWICCQLGAREHYSIPRALKSQKRLRLLLTEAWADHFLPFGMIPGGRARERFHPELSDARIESWNWATLGFEAFSRTQAHGWDLICKRNDWFQGRAIEALQRYRRGEPAILFCYSYASEKLLAFAKSQGWKTVLGQIDPGPVEEEIVKDLNAKEPRYSGNWTPAPASYWKSWRVECDLADRILVNSQWSYQALVTTGIAENKLQIAPLAFRAPACSQDFVRSYPSAFTEDRPMRVLFLGQVCLRKGIGVFLDAIEMLCREPIEFCVVGYQTIDIPGIFLSHRRIHWSGPVPRSAVNEQYRRSDVFLFPTFSDGFGLTQLEAQAWKLPSITSRYCGEVVRHMENGYILNEVTPETVANALRFLVRSPHLLQTMSRRCNIAERFTLSSLARNLASVEASLLTEQS